MNEDSIQRLGETLRDCTSALLASVEAPVEFVADGEIEGAQHDIAATLGFMSEPVRGALVITAHQGVMRALLPQELRGGEVTDAQVCDWAGEFANQLLGRLKNQLLRFGVTLGISTPSVVTGHAIHHRTRPKIITLCSAFRHADGSLQAFLDAMVVDGFELVEEGDAGLQEGELEFF